VTVAFWDTSAIVPLCVHQSRTSVLARLARKQGRLVVWWGTPVEARSALARLVWEAAITEGGYDQAAARLLVLRRTWAEVLPTERVRSLAEMLPAQYDLRGADAFQLAAAMVWARERPRNRPFVCYDRKLALAADRIGFSVIIQ